MVNLKDYFLNEIDIKTVKQNNQVGFPDTKARQHLVLTVNAHEIEFFPYVENGKLEVHSIVRSQGNRYSTKIRFDNVDFGSEDDNGVVEIEGPDEEQYFIFPLSEFGDNVSMSCNCMDFRFRFANQHSQNKSLVGNPPPTYVRVTNNRPPVNPTNAIGACKHVLALIRKLRQYGVIV
jgi:hypothetical protein